MKRVLIVRGSGFLGDHVVSQAQAEKFEITTLSAMNGEIVPRELLEEQFARQKYDVLINCAGNIGGIHYIEKNAGDVIHDNTQLVLNIYRAVAHTSPTTKIISSLGNCSYPGNADAQRESEWQHGPVHDSVLPFAATKRLQYAVAESYRRQYGISTVHWIMANNYGPGGGTDPEQERALNGIIIRLIKAQRDDDKQFTIWGTGTPVREWLYVGDAARILTYSVNHVDEQTYPVNVAKGQGHSIKQVAEIAAQHLGYAVRFAHDTSKPDGALVKVMDSTVFRKKYPEFTFTTLEEGIRATIEYYKKIL